MSMIRSLVGALRPCPIRLAFAQTALRPISSFNQLAPLANGVTKRSFGNPRPRACYKCDQIGHEADQCPSATRLCWNCKDPNHESRDCPFPRTHKEKTCYICQGVGHVRANCPTLRQGRGSGPTSTQER